MSSRMADVLPIILISLFVAALGAFAVYSSIRFGFTRKGPDRPGNGMMFLWVLVCVVGAGMTGLGILAGACGVILSGL